MRLDWCELCTGNISAGQWVAIERGIESEIRAQVADADHR